jgi:hypothetical protein
MAAFYLLRRVCDGALCQMFQVYHIAKPLSRKITHQPQKTILMICKIKNGHFDKADLSSFVFPNGQFSLL